MRSQRHSLQIFVFKCWITAKYLSILGNGCCAWYAVAAALIRHLRDIGESGESPYEPSIAELHLDRFVTFHHKGPSCWPSWKSHTQL